MSLKKGHSMTCAGVEYKLQTTVGGGGSGDVWLARAQESLWAIKVLRSGANREKIKRFHREASFQESCGHDHIVPVVGRGEYGGQAFYIMPYYTDTFRRIVDRREADATTLLSYIEQVGEAVQFAHEHGIVHRDIKPENIVVDGNFAALADFGIAHFVDSTLTSVGDLVGNRDYHAPEQQKGRDARDVGPAADVYALGLVVNECFTGETPAGSSYTAVETSHPLMSYLDPIVARMLAQSPGNRPTIADVLTHIRFFEAKKNDEIAEIEDTLRLDANVPRSDSEKFQPLFRQASEDIWYAASLIASKTPTELNDYNGNWHMRVGYDADAFLRNLCVQSRLLDLCRSKFEYETTIYRGGQSYKPLNVDGEAIHRNLYSQARAVVSDHPLPPEHDLTGRILKTFASCAEHHCAELLTEARRAVAEVDDNLLDAPILWIVKYLASNVPSIRHVDNLSDRFRINWSRSGTFEENIDDAGLFTKIPRVLDPDPVLEAFKESWGVAITRIDDWRCSIMFRTPSEYQRFRAYALGLAEDQSLFEADVVDLFRDAASAGGITQLTLSLSFDVSNTLAKVLGHYDI